MDTRGRNSAVTNRQSLRQLEWVGAVLEGNSYRVFEWISIEVVAEGSERHDGPVCGSTTLRPSVDRRTVHEDVIQTDRGASHNRERP